MPSSRSDLLLYIDVINTSHVCEMPHTYTFLNLMNIMIHLENEKYF